MPYSGSQVPVKIDKIANRKQACQITTGAAESRTEPAFVKFQHAPIEALPHRLSDVLLRATPMKNIKSSKFENNLKNK